MPHKKSLLSLVMLAASLLLLSLLILPGCAKSPASIAPPAKPSSEPPVKTPDAKPTPLTVLSIMGGDIQVMKKGTAAWKKGAEGMALDVSDKIKTDAGGKALITFFEGSTIELEGDTEISLLELGINADQSTAVKVRQEVGQTFSRAKKLLDTKDRYEVETPAAVAAVRGSIMYIQVVLNGRTFVGNIEGKVVVIALGIEVQVPQGSHSSIVPGQPAGAPEPGATPTPPPVTTPPVTSVTPPPTTSATPKPTPTPTSSPTPTLTTPPAPVKPPLTIKIVSLKHGDLVGRSVTVSGVVNDPSITEGTLMLNGVSRKLIVGNGSFSATVSLADGVNTIAVIVTRDGIPASDSVTLDPAQG